MNGVWSKEKAWEWYNNHTWIRGCNFMGSDCANRIDQWQELGFEERLKTADEELELAAKTGFNAMRIILEFIVWDEEHDGFMERFDRYLDTMYKHGIRAMVVFGNDCMPPKNEAWKPLKLGVQHYDWGYHGGRKMSQHSQFVGMGYHIIDEPGMAERHYEWVREIMTKYRNDDRIIMWDLYNEVGASKRTEATKPHIKKYFEIAREIDPIQPLTCCVWHLLDENNRAYSEVEQFAIDNSDIVSFHTYSNLETTALFIRRLKSYGRPIVNTEWLGRCLHNTVQEIFPLFFCEKVGCFNWGFVAGLYQTYEPWNGSWQAYEKDPHYDIDFTKWFHDLYRPNHHPYDPKEIELIKRLCDLADKEFEKSKK